MSRVLKKINIVEISPEFNNLLLLNLSLRQNIHVEYFNFQRIKIPSRELTWNRCRNQILREAKVFTFMEYEILDDVLMQ